MANHNPLVSVIIPCYNLGLYLDEAVESVLAQTYTNFEIIIVNDGSTDEYTINLLRNYKKPKTTIYHTENKGVSAARNFGIAHSSGEYILPLDADDKLHSQFLEKAIPFMNNNDIVYSSVELFGEENGLLKIPQYEITLQLKQNLIINTSLHRRTLWEKSGGYSLNMKQGWEDWDYWLKLIELGSLVYHIPDVLFYYRILPKSRNRSFTHQDKSFLEQQLISNHFSLYLKHFPEPLTLLRELDELRKEKEEFEKYKQQIYNSASYRIGSFILKPFKLLRKYMK